ncbi:WapI family immunity protein [Pseudomonas asplenii]|uniref:Uncharacterized protein n=1 Tax=Pseudomonas asplenii TaxID=53407 RepID=A0A1H6P2W6_9PSED|nr:hypothetical protein [Pseudomonas fuscovaginae]SEI20103.1 hypothetical protein SAMN05216581_4133 [Pseudomonas fuscovaginae]
MICIKKGGREFFLKVSRYEFFRGEREDLNWLFVKIGARLEDGLSWRAEGAYLQAGELVDFFEWLNLILSGSEVSRLEFVEGEVSFGYSLGEGFCVILDFSLHPKGDKYIYGCDSEYKIYFDLNELEFRRLSESVKKTIEEFPIRWG